LSIEAAELKARLLKLLEEDKEFRYAVAGLIGLGEVLKRLDRHEEQLVKIWEEIAKLREDLVKGFERHDRELERVWNEIAKLREDMLKGFERHDKEFEKVWSEMAKLREEMTKGFERYDQQIAKLREDMLKEFERHNKEFERIWSEIAKLREDMIKGFERHDKELASLREEQKRIWEEIRRIWEEIKSLREEQKGLREDFRKMLARIQRIERTLDHISVSIEDEARDAVAWLLSKYGIVMQITDVRIDEKYEFDIYGSTDSFTIIGDAKVRASAKTLRRLLDRIEEARKVKPEVFRGKVIPVLYCLKFVGDPAEAEKMGVWLIKSDKELTKLKL